MCHFIFLFINSYVNHFYAGLTFESGKAYSLYVSGFSTWVTVKCFLHRSWNTVWWAQLLVYIQSAMLSPVRSILLWGLLWSLRCWSLCRTGYTCGTSPKDVVGGLALTLACFTLSETLRWWIKVPLSTLVPDSGIKVFFIHLFIT